MEFALLNGNIIKRSDAKIDIEDRGYQFGDGVYEVIRIYNGRMFTIDEHLNRFLKSAESIGISIPFTSLQLKELLDELLLKNNLETGNIYMQVTRGTAPRNHLFPSGDIMPTLVAYTIKGVRPLESLKSGVKAILTEDIRWLRCDIKSLNLLGNLLAKQKASEQGCFEAIQHRGDDVTEGSSSNIFIVKNGTVITHESNHLILKGITKDVILDICVINNIPVQERTFSVAELEEADEVFLSSTTAEVMPVVEINGKKVQSGVPGHTTRKLQELFEKEIENQCGVLLR
ncbi:D-amino-acid transaminase [Neobacillus niacini]|jgi:D-alanine transaminase|uniref:D-amino-acid transaminase n=1 Tax=Neobacillus niacini TaxID=86668 RepID=UPI001C8D7B87|nr:D-amino-acid transaminase [Neobacillus niacini]MBY0146531.1 D-amino-acid transaminase [Neobacillus niacini]